MTRIENALSGLRILVPRGGTWGSVVAKGLRENGGIPVTAPLVDFSHTADESKLRDSLAKLEEGYFDWMTATNATVVDVLNHHNVRIAKRTQVAVVGEATLAAFEANGYEVARKTTESDPTAAGLLTAWPEINDENALLKVLTLRSNVAKPVLTEGLLARGHNVTQVVAYRTVGVPSSVLVREDVASGHINALLITSPQVAREVLVQFREIPENTVIAFLNDQAREEAKRLGLSQGLAASGKQQRALERVVLETIDIADMMD